MELTLCFSLYINVSQPEQVLKSPGELLKPMSLDNTLKVFGSVDLGWESRIYISSKFLIYADAFGLTTNWKLLPGKALTCLYKRKQRLAMHQ